jgi:hypothetical protein
MTLAGAGMAIRYIGGVIYIWRPVERDWIAEAATGGWEDGGWRMEDHV